MKVVTTIPKVVATITKVVNTITKEVATSPRSHCGFLLPSSLSASSSSGLSGGSDWLFFTRPPQPQPRHVHVAACYFHGCVRQTPKGLGCADKPPTFSSRDRIFNRIFRHPFVTALKILFF